MTREVAIQAGVVAAGVVLAILVLAALRRRRRRRAEAGEDLEPVHAEHEISPAIERLLGTPAIAPARLAIPPRAEHPGRVPGPGVLHVGGVDLPSGRPTRPVRAVGLELVVTEGDPPAGSERLWVASTPSLGAPALWKRLAAALPETGLWPLLLPQPEDATEHAWFDEPARRHGVLRPRADDSSSPRGTGRRLDALDEAFAVLGRSRLALAPARRPADVLHEIAWTGADRAGIATADLADAVASWERRYGALLVGVDEASLVLAVLQPPANDHEAAALAAEVAALRPSDPVEPSALVDAAAWRLAWR
jgi:hypothetical protein